MIAQQSLQPNCHGDAMAVFHKLCRIARSSRSHKTEWEWWVTHGRRQRFPQSGTRNIVWVRVVTGLHGQHFYLVQCTPSRRLKILHVPHRQRAKYALIKYVLSCESSVSGPNTWNDLPPHVTCAPVFGQHLKTFLFTRSYPNIFIWLIHFRLLSVYLAIINII